MSAAAPSLRALVLEEWPGLSAEALDAAIGETERLVELVAEHSGHTRALARRKLAELGQLVAEGQRAGDAAPAGEGGAAGALPADLRRQVDALMRSLEERARHLGAQVREEVVPQAEQKVKEAEDKLKENLLVSLLVAMGFGLLVGLILGGSLGRGR